MQRKYGVCTWTFGPLGIGDVAARIAALGFDGVELHGDLEAFRPRPVRELFAGLGLEIFSLTPADVDLAHPDADVRQAAVDYHLRLVDFAAELGGATVACHGRVGRVRALASWDEEWRLLGQSLRPVLARAGAAGVPLVFEVLNRYESHLVNTGEQAARLIHELGTEGGAPLRMLLDTYHMNIEEADPAQAVRRAGSRLGLFHVADSNRLGLGGGHTDFAPIVAALDEAGYRGPVIVEATAAGPDPFTAVKPGDYVGALERELAASLRHLRVLEAPLAA
jgi:sugar phosphate isomerase/epimerase